MVLVNFWLSTLLVKPTLLPRLDYSGGIPEDCRTMVVVPTMLANGAGVDRLIETLEIHHLANRDEHLHFALLTDFRDAPAEIMPGDDILLQRARVGIELLNRKYPANGRNLFFLLHRPRRWNAGENLWMGYERKRGKLMEFNALLRGGARACFSEIVGETAPWNLAGRPDTFVSEELTTWFRGEPQAVHILCFGITPQDHEWLQAHADDVESCAGAP